MNKQVIFFSIFLFSLNSGATHLTQYNPDLPRHLTFLNILTNILSSNRETEPDKELVNKTRVSDMSEVDSYIIENDNKTNVGLLTLSEKRHHPEAAIEFSVYMLPKYRRLGHATNALREAEEIVIKQKKRNCISAIVGKHQQCLEYSRKLLNRANYDSVYTNLLINGRFYELYCKDLKSKQ